MQEGDRAYGTSRGSAERGGGKEMRETSGKLTEKDDAEVIKPVARYANAAAQITRSEKRRCLGNPYLPFPIKITISRVCHRAGVRGVSRYLCIARIRDVGPLARRKTRARKREAIQIRALVHGFLTFNYLPLETARGKEVITEALAEFVH